MMLSSEVIRRLGRVLLWAAACSIAATNACCEAREPRTLRVNDWLLEETDSTLKIMRSGALVMVYNKISPEVPEGIDPIYRRSGFLHPVATPEGKVVTAAFPFDHPHQHGVFSAWTRTTYADRKVDFWNLKGGTGRVVHERIASIFGDASKGELGFEADLIHRAEQSPPIDVLRERWRVAVQTSGEAHYCIDLETTQSALTDQPLIVEKYHYGGVAVSRARQLAAGSGCGLRWRGAT